MQFSDISKQVCLFIGKQVCFLFISKQVCFLFISKQVELLVDGAVGGVHVDCGGDEEESGSD